MAFINSIFSINIQDNGHFVIFVLLFVNLLPFAFNQIIHRKCSCDGIGKSCNFSAVYCTSDESCDKENVALGKPTSFSSILNLKSVTYDKTASLGCLAVNGNLNPMYITGFDNNPMANCFMSGLSDLNPEWNVFLGTTYLIDGITIYADEKYTRSLQNVTVYVGLVICYEFGTSGQTIPIVNNIKCASSLKGSVVQLRKLTLQDQNQAFDSNRLLVFCEVQVWVRCEPGRMCNRSPCISKQHCEGDCDPFQGQCTKGCAEGFYGHLCANKCGACMQNVCEANGNCSLGCEPGWTGTYCTEEEDLDTERERKERNNISLILGAITGVVTAVITMSVLHIMTGEKKQKKKKSVDHRVRSISDFNMPEAVIPTEASTPETTPPEVITATACPNDIRKKNSTTVDQREEVFAYEMWGGTPSSFIQSFLGEDRKTPASKTGSSMDDDEDYEDDLISDLIDDDYEEEYTYVYD